MRGRLGAAPFRINSRSLSLDDRIIDAVLEPPRRVLAVEPVGVRVVFAEQQIGCAVADHLHRRHIGVTDEDRCRAARRELRFRRNRLPGPDIAGPDLRQHVELRGSRPAIMRGDQQQNVVRRGLGVFDLDVEIAIFVEDAGVDQLVFAILQTPRGVDRDKIGVGKRALRIFVEHFHVGVGRNAIEIIIELLDVFAVIALRRW